MVYRVLSIFSGLVFAFLLGVLTVVFNWYPYRVLHEAFLAATAVKDVALSDVYFGDVLPERPSEVAKVSVAKVLAADHGDELILCSGGEAFHTDLHSGGCVAWLINRRGEVVHYWKYDATRWDDRQRVAGLKSTFKHYPVCVHLYSDGGLLVSYQAANSFPFAVGLVRLDKDSQVLWKKELLAHHWFSVGSDGRIYTPTMRPIDAPIPIGRTEAVVDSPNNKVLADYITILDSDGNVLDELSVMDAVYDSGLSGLVWRWNGAESIQPRIITEDPLHLNDVRLITPEIAARWPRVRAGDLLVSLRNVNTVGVIDMETRAFKWINTGSTVHQHSPRFWNDSILSVDNLGGDPTLGLTQLVAVNTKTGIPRVVFPLAEHPPPSICTTTTAGHLDLSEDENRALFSLSADARIWEIDLRDGRVLWEYLSICRLSADVSVFGPILTAKYVSHVSFPLNRESTP